MEKNVKASKKARKVIKYMVVNIMQFFTLKVFYFLKNTTPYL